MVRSCGAGAAQLGLGGHFENPVLEPGVEQRGAVAGNERALLDVDAPVLRGGSATT